MLIHHSKFIAGGAHVQAAHRGRQLHQRDGKQVVNKYLQDLHHKNNDKQSEIRIEHQNYRQL